MKWKKFTPYWIYFITMLLIQAVTWLVEPWLLLLFFGMFWITAFLMVVMIRIMGSSLQRNLGCSSLAERLGISAIGSFMVIAVTPVCISIIIGRFEADAFWQSGILWLAWGIHSLMMYLSMELTYRFYGSERKESSKDTAKTLSAKKEMNSASETEEAANSDSETEEPVLQEFVTAQQAGEKRKHPYLLPVIYCSILVLLIAATAVSIKYQTSYKKTMIKESVSSDGAYQASIYQIGEPEFPFGATHCRVVLEKDKKQIQKYDFAVRNDGGNVSKNNFTIRWKADCAEIISSGEEQADERITVPFDGMVSCERIKTDLEEDDSNSIDKSKPEEEPQQATIPETGYAESEQIYEGYLAIYKTYFEAEGYDFIPSCSPKGNSRFILKEDEENIEFLAYDRLSQNQKCELYVLYRCEKAEDGSWSPSEASILDIFAYEISDKEVVSSGKTTWSDVADTMYYEVTGEK